jgi:ribosomal-protein-alanine N-acetyltransferase
LITVLQERDGAAEAFLAAAVQPSAFPNEEKAAWLRLIMPPSSDYRPRAMDDLWRDLRSKLLMSSITQVSLLDMDDWVGRYAEHWRFSPTNSVITFRRRNHVPLPAYENTGILIRDCTHADLSAICQIDWGAFAPIWRYDANALLTALQQSSTCTVLETNGEIAGYQMSTRHAESGHLARLAISPPQQGKGLGALLLREMIIHFHQRNITTITVNTQEDNLHSQRLYMRYGFEATGHSVPIWTLSL